MTVSVDELARVSHAVDGSIAHACSQVLNDVLYMSQQQLPDEILHHLLDASFNSSSKGYPVYFPCPFKETEAISALKAIEASTVAAIADVRFKERRRRIDIDVEQATCSLFAAYLSAVNGMGKFHPDVRSRLKGLIDTLCDPCCFIPTFMLKMDRHRLARSTVDSVPAALCKSIRHEESGRVFSHPWLP